MLTISYTPTKEDMLRYFRYAMAKRRKMGPALGLVVGLVYLVAGFYGVVFVSYPSELAMRIDCLAFAFFFYYGCALLWSCFPLRSRMLLEKYMKTVPGMLAERRVSLDEKSVRVTSAYGESILRCQAIYQIEFYANNTYISIGQTVVILPEAAFADASGARACYSTVMEYWQAAKLVPLEEQNSVWPPPPRVGI